MAAEDTVDNTETQQPGNGNPEATPAAEPAPSATETQQEKVDKAEFDRVQNELNKARQRENQLINQRKKEEEERLKEANEYKTLYEQKVAEENAQKEQDNLRQLRDKAIESFSDETAKKIAKNLVNKNPNALFWTNATSEDEAMAEVHSQMEAFKIQGSPDTEQATTPPVNGNNPLPTEQNQAASEPTDVEARIERLKAFEKKYAGQPLI